MNDPGMHATNSARTDRLAEVTCLKPARSDAELVEALTRGERWAKAAVFDRYGVDVHRVLTWVMGVDRETSCGLAVRAAREREYPS